MQLWVQIKKVWLRVQRGKCVALGAKRKKCSSGCKYEMWGSTGKKEKVRLLVQRRKGTALDAKMKGCALAQIRNVRLWAQIIEGPWNLEFPTTVSLSGTAKLSDLEISDLESTLRYIGVHVA